MRHKRQLRIPKAVAQKMRDIRDSYADRSVRDMSTIVDIALRKVRDTDYVAINTREGSESITVWLTDEFANIPHAAIVARVSMAVMQTNPKPLRFEVRNV